MCRTAIFDHAREGQDCTHNHSTWTIIFLCSLCPERAERGHLRSARLIFSTEPQVLFFLRAANDTTPSFPGWDITLCPNWNVQNNIREEMTFSCCPNCMRSKLGFGEYIGAVPFLFELKEEMEQLEDWLFGGGAVGSLLGDAVNYTWCHPWETGFLNGVQNGGQNGA
ncbi:uncharacterized protein BDZ99DRAFT_521641 [Mytilinidion resinicola]|uniref:Uncharacterized protein n=1 Tax=Mytilinidion resinicola TaxID=574789 RepID=A0A6A6YKX3_9PEZI|nr:uncharacterized protein BDZ99DRAFT_521641 [Mytilinidion resinicola]KAF2809203.1 hypothetical protein BDZ99DRAFT_521641 [Mytilinidion resinicola]